MAILTGTSMSRQFIDGLTDRTALYAMRNVTSGDTANLSADFSVVKQAVILGTTVAGSEAVGTISGTTVTIPAGLAGDAGWMLVWGCSA